MDECICQKLKDNSECHAKNHVCSCDGTSEGNCYARKDHNCMCDGSDGNYICIAKYEDHICTCCIDDETHLICHASEHKCSCDLHYNICRANHTCICNGFDKNNKCIAKDNIHNCTCHRNEKSYLVCRADDNHDCSCNFNYNLCLADHKCICNGINKYDYSKLCITENLHLICREKYHVCICNINHELCRADYHHCSCKNSDKCHAEFHMCLCESSGKCQVHKKIELIK
jgi:hypothetical protein